MKRRETSFRPYIAEVDARSIDIDFSLPTLDCGSCDSTYPLRSFQRAASLHRSK